jgi:hypothetical protein
MRFWYAVLDESVLEAVDGRVVQFGDDGRHVESVD